MSHTVSIEVFKFDELEDRARERARDWFRMASADDSFWSECVIEDAKTIGGFLGFDVKEVYWSGFGSQGDGEHAPKDKELARIRKAMRAFARAHRDNSANLTHRDRYSHEYSVSIEAEPRRGNDYRDCARLYALDISGARARIRLSKFR